MDIKTIASVVYLLILIVYAIVMFCNDVEVGETLYWVPFLCITAAYICGCIRGGVFG